LTTRQLVVAASFLAIFALVCGFGVDTDTWWHLRAGQFILENHSLPETDSFTFTRQDATWHYPGWLADTIMTMLYRAGGAAALSGLTAVCVLLAFVLVYRTLSGDAFLKSFILLLAAYASSIFWSARPQIFSLVLSAFFFYLLHQYIWKNQNRLWILPLGMAVWVNLHGGYAIGFIFLALALVGQTGVTLFAQATARAVEWQKLKWIAAAAFGCLLAVGVNPYGYEMLVYPFRTVSISLLQQYIQEWQSPNFHTLQAQSFLWLLFGTFIAAGISGVRMDFREIVFLTGTSYLGFLAARNIELMIVVAPSILSYYANVLLVRVTPNWEGQVNQFRDGFQKRMNTGLLCFIACAVGAFAWWMNSPASIAAKLAKQEPVAAVQWLAQRPGKGNLLNAYNWGAYLLWELPQYKVFIDGRTDLFGDDILSQYVELINAGPRSQSLLTRWDIRVALLDPAMPLVQRLQDSGWLVAYQDAQAIVLERAD
jgi:hypothetical protein